MKNALLKGTLAGYAGSLSLICSVTFLFLPFGRNISPIVIGLFGAFISSILYILLAWRIKNNTEIICYSLVSFISFAVFMVVHIAIRVSIPPVFGILRENDNADGIFLLFIIGTFAAASLFLKLCAFIVFIVRNIYKKKHSSTQ